MSCLCTLTEVTDANRIKCLSMSTVLDLSALCVMVNTDIVCLSGFRKNGNISATLV